MYKSIIPLITEKLHFDNNENKTWRDIQGIHKTVHFPLFIVLFFLIFIKMDAEKCKIPKNNTKFVTLFLCVTDI